MPKTLFLILVLVLNSARLLYVFPLVLRGILILAELYA